MAERNDCQHFIPLATGELLDLLCADRALPEADRDQFRALCGLLTAAHHLHYHSRLRELKAAYAAFDPDSDATTLVALTPSQKQHRLNGLFSDLAWLLDQAHFTHLSREAIEPVLDRASDWGIRMDVDFSAFDHIAIFARGDAYETRTRRRWLGLRQPEEVEVPVYRRLVLAFKLRQHPRLGPRVNTEHVFLKLFKDVPKLDVMMLLPGARVHLRLLDRGKIGFGLLSGLTMTAYNLFHDLVNFVQTLLLSNSAMWTLTAGCFGYGYKTWYGYQQTKQAYHLSLTQSLYFQNLDSNAGVLTRLLDEAEEQDSRLTILAYYCLWHYAGADGWSPADLEASLEVYLDRYADVPLLCQKGEALAHLQRLGLVEAHGERFRATPPARAVAALEGAWDRYRTAPLAGAGRFRQESPRGPC